MKKYAFVDRDGTIIFEPPDTFYVDSLDKLQILPGVIQTLQLLKKKGYSLVMVTNQDGLGSDYNPTDVFNRIQAALLGQLKKEGIEFERILVCPHYAEDNCQCRKPKTGLIKDITDIDKESSLMIGDREADVQFARNLHIKDYKLIPNRGMEDLEII